MITARSSADLVDRVEAQEDAHAALLHKFDGGCGDIEVQNALLHARVVFVAHQLNVDPALYGEEMSGGRDECALVRVAHVHTYTQSPGCSEGKATAGLHNTQQAATKKHVNARTQMRRSSGQ